MPSSALLFFFFSQMMAQTCLHFPGVVLDCAEPLTLLLQKLLAFFKLSGQSLHAVCSHWKRGLGFALVNCVCLECDPKLIS